MIDLRLIIYRSRKKKSNNYVISVTWLVQHAHRSSLLLVAGYVRYTFILILFWELGPYSSFISIAKFLLALYLTLDEKITCKKLCRRQLDCHCSEHLFYFII